MSEPNFFEVTGFGLCIGVAFQIGAYAVRAFVAWWRA